MGDGNARADTFYFVLLSEPLIGFVNKTGSIRITLPFPLIPQLIHLVLPLQPTRNIPQ
jgi:hypothetical protein